MSDGTQFSIMGMSPSMFEVTSGLERASITGNGKLCRSANERCRFGQNCSYLHLRSESTGWCAGCRCGTSTPVAHCDLGHVICSKCAAAAVPEGLAADLVVMCPVRGCSKGVPLSEVLRIVPEPLVLRLLRGLNTAEREAAEADTQEALLELRDSVAAQLPAELSRAIRNLSIR